MLKKYFKFLVLISIFLASSTIFAQRPCPPGQRPNPGGNPPCIPVGPPTPIDGGLVILLAAGAAYGIKKLRE